MELVLIPEVGTHVTVVCDGEASHSFDLAPLSPERAKQEELQRLILDDPAGYGRMVYEALFPLGSRAEQMIVQRPPRVLLVTDDVMAQAVWWECAYGPGGFVVEECHFVRALPSVRPTEAPSIGGALHVVAVPSDPLSARLARLNIEGEWERLKEIIGDVPNALTLERARPPTLARLRELVTRRSDLVIHFMGHGEYGVEGARLLFENDWGGEEQVSAEDFVQLIGKSAFLVTLNACDSATAGLTEFSNLAAALVRRGVPYVLGMQAAVVDEDARLLSRALYGELARGSSVEEAVCVARQELSRSGRPWAVAVPVLYTAVAEPRGGIPMMPGRPNILEHQPPVAVTALPRAEGVLQGRIDVLKALGKWLTSDTSPGLIRIHGGGGQGKSALAHAAVERFAWAWPGGILAISLEALPSRAVVVAELARFLGIPTDGALDELERAVVARLAQRRTLLVLDRAETLVEAVEARDETALELASFLRERLPRPPVSLLVTSRRWLEWDEEEGIELGGLPPEYGAGLFLQSAPRRAEEIDLATARQLSARVDGHPLSLRLLGSAFDDSRLLLREFVAEFQTQLELAEDKYRDPDHRNRSLFASIDTSVRSLPEELRDLLGGLLLFHAPFRLEIAAGVLDPEGAQEESSGVYERRLHALWQRGLLARHVVSLRDGALHLYRLLPSVRSYIERYVPPAWPSETLAARFRDVYAALAYWLSDEIDYNPHAAAVARHAREDLEQVAQSAIEAGQGEYLLSWGKVVGRLGDRRRAIELLEWAVEFLQGGIQPRLEITALNRLAHLYQQTGQPRRAFELCEHSLSIQRAIGDRSHEAATLTLMAGLCHRMGETARALELYEQAQLRMQETGSPGEQASLLTDMAQLYHQIGQPNKALDLCKQALPVAQAEGNLVQQAATLNTMAMISQETGRPRKALDLYQQVLPILREVSARAEEAGTLINMAAAHQQMGDLSKALELSEQALPILEEVGDLNAVGATHNNMGGVYQQVGDPLKALEFYQKALEIVRTLDDPAMEARVLNNSASMYQQMGQLTKARELYELVLPIVRRVHDRAEEANTLVSMAGLFLDLRRPEKAIELFEQALTIFREVDHPAREALALNNMAEAYQRVGQPQKALELYKQVLSLLREVGDPANEARTLCNMAGLYYLLGQREQVLELYQRALRIVRDKGLPEGEAVVLNQLGQLLAGLGRGVEAVAALERSVELIRGFGAPGPHSAALVALGSVLYAMGRGQEAIARMEAALALLADAGLTHNAAGLSVEDLRRSLASMEGEALQEVGEDTKVEAAVRDFVQAEDDLAAARRILEAQQELLFRPEAETWLERAIATARAEGYQHGAKARMFQLGLLRRCKAVGIEAAFAELETASEQGNSSVVAELVAYSIAGLLSGPTERMRHEQVLRAMQFQTPDEHLKRLLGAIRLALLGTDLKQLGQDLDGIYRAAWDDIVMGVRTEGVDPELLAMIANNTGAVLGPAPERHREWRSVLLTIREEARQYGPQQLALLANAAIALLDAGGDARGLGAGLTGIYAETWQAIVQGPPNPWGATADGRPEI